MLLSYRSIFQSDTLLNLPVPGHTQALIHQFSSSLLSAPVNGYPLSTGIFCIAPPYYLSKTVLFMDYHFIFNHLMLQSCIAIYVFLILYLLRYALLKLLFRYGHKYLYQICIKLFTGNFLYDPHGICMSPRFFVGPPHGYC